MKGRTAIAGLIGAALGAVIGTILASGAAHVGPPKFESLALIEITSGTAVSGLGNEIVERDIQTACGVLTSYKVLEATVDTQSLEQAWDIDRESCIERLREIIHIQSPENSNLIEIRVRHYDSRETRDIARELIRNYEDYMAILHKKHIADFTRVLNNQLRKTRDQIDERRKTLFLIMKERGLGFHMNSAGDVVPYIASKPPESVTELERAEKSLDLIDFLDFQNQLDVLLDLKLELQRKLQEARSAAETAPTIVLHSEPQIAIAPIENQSSRRYSVMTVTGTIIGLILFTMASLACKPKVAAPGK